MIPLDIILEGDGCWTDLATTPPIRGELRAVALLRGGMQSGKASVCFRVQLPDGGTVLAETSLSLLLAAARAFAVRAEQDE